MSIPTEFMSLAGVYQQTFRSADWEAWGSLFQEDADFVTWGGVWWRSRAEIIAGHRKVDEWVQAQTGGYVLRPLDASALATGIVLAHAAWEWPGFRSSALATAEDRTGVLTMLLVPTDRGWRIRASHNTRAA
ncbi:SgcJ/EcaC family oxidoreductase [Phenylobacterium terrae]|uniref:SgcJ/EcaC family oxidoreductase n=1 Tax=Phenylobacterium terrae TaxID=2665495 RepID=A0ABW4NA83_9CAUL